MSLEETLAAVNEAIKLNNAQDYAGAWAKVADIAEDAQIWTNAGAAKVRGICLWQGKKDLDAAHAWFARIVAEHPEDQGAIKYGDSVAIEMKRNAFQVAKALLAANKLEEAEAAYAAISLEPPIKDDIRIGTAINWGSCLMGLDRNFEAQQSFEMAIEMKPDCLEAHFNRGVLLNKDKRFSEAYLSFAEVLKIKPGLPQALSASFECLRQLHRSQDLLEMCSKIIEEDQYMGKDFRPFFYRAFANCELKSYLDGISDGKEALARGASGSFQNQITAIMVHCYKEHGDELLEGGDASAALEQFELALGIVHTAPEQRDILLSKANALVQIPDIASATSLLQSCTTSFPDDNAPFLESLGMLQLKNGEDMEMAMCNLSLGLSGELTIAQADSLYNLGMCQYKSGDIALALSTFEHTLALDPSHTEAVIQCDAMRMLIDMASPAEVEPLPLPSPPVEEAAVAVAPAAVASPQAQPSSSLAASVAPPDFVSSAEDTGSRVGYTFRADGPNGAGYYKTFIATRISDFDSQSAEAAATVATKLEEDHGGLYEFLEHGPLGAGLYEKQEMARMRSMGWTDEFIRVKLRIAPMRSEDDFIRTAADKVPKQPTVEIEGEATAPLERVYLTPGENIFAYSELTTQPFPSGVDPTQREMYLSDEEFVQYLKKTKGEWSTIPKWRQNNSKKSAKLF
jgi:tetratricopeptide (TPR) repeat protein